MNINRTGDNTYTWHISENEIKTAFSSEADYCLLLFFIFRFMAKAGIITEFHADYLINKFFAVHDKNISEKGKVK